MSFLGIQGMGLVEATERSPVVGQIIGKHISLLIHFSRISPVPTNLVLCICKLSNLKLMRLGDQ